MEELTTLLLQHGLKPFFFDQELTKLEKKVTRSELIALLLVRLRGQMTMSKLATELGAPLSTVTNIGQRLKRRGLIERNRDPRDRRSILVSLTSEGEQLADFAFGLIQRIIKQVERTLTPEEMTLFFGLIAKVIKAIQTMEPIKEKEMSSLKKIQITD